MVWAKTAITTSPYAQLGIPGYDKLKTIIDIQVAKKLRANPDASRQFALGAKGIVRLFEDCLNSEAARTGVWKMIEEPTVEANTAVTALHVVNPKDGLEYIVWERVGGAIMRKTAVATGTPIVATEPLEIVWSPPTPPGSQTGSPPRGGTPVVGGAGPVYSSPLPNVQVPGRPGSAQGQRVGVGAPVQQNRPGSPPPVQGVGSIPVSKNRGPAPPVPRPGNFRRRRL